MKFGYISVSWDKRTTILQEDAMEKEQCERTFQGESDISGALGWDARSGNIIGRSW